MNSRIKIVNKLSEENDIIISTRTLSRRANKSGLHQKLEKDKMRLKNEHKRKIELNGIWNIENGV